MTQRENFTGKDYNPCMQWNLDAFCCSPAGYQFRKNILASQAPLTVSKTYQGPIPNNPEDSRPLWLATTGIVDPTPYNFPPQAQNYTWCSRIPCGLDQNGKPPCQSNMASCGVRGSCSGK
jgi:hypothetical protein